MKKICDDLIKEFDKQQLELKKEIKIKDIDLSKIKTIAGIDIAYWEKDSIEYGGCSIVILDYKTKKIIEKVEYVGKIFYPYISGYLSFREIPLILETLKKVKTNIDLYMLDGNGYLHPKHMGIATHISHYLKKPCIGVAKTYLKVNNIKYFEPLNIVGAYTEIRNNDDILGIALRTKKDCKPIFVSIGNYISLHNCYDIVMNLINSESRIPLPTRYADIETHLIRKKYKE